MMEIALAVVGLVALAAMLYIAGELLVSGLLYVAKYFQVREFMVAFFVMAFAASIPNLLVGVTSALQGMPELSFGDIMGNNMVALTVAIGLAILFAPKKEIPLENKTVQDMTFVTAIAALLPILLLADGVLSQADGVVLLLFFACYVYWMYDRRDLFSKVYEEGRVERTAAERKLVLRAIFKVVVGVTLLAVTAQLVVYVASFVSTAFGIPLILMGLVVLGFSGALPEVYFTIISARKGETSLIMGNLMGAVIVPASFVLGIVAVIHPIENKDLEFPVIARIFLVIVAAFFLYMSRTKNVVTWRESIILLTIYASFIAALVWAW